MIKKLWLTAVLLFITVACIKAQTTSRISGPHAIVYKTKGDYRHLVPVLLSADKKSIISYPHPSDLRYKGGYALPVQLHKGYLLDNRGIGPNTAFLSMTYEEYGKLDNAPSTSELFAMVKDKNPLLLYCDCGSRTKMKNPVREINKLIDKGLLKKRCNVR